MRIYLTVLFFLFTSLSIPAQVKSRTEQLDSLRLKLSKDSAQIYRNTIARPYLRLENRRSFIETEKVSFLGFLAGATLYDRHIVCAGFYFLPKRSADWITPEPGIRSQKFEKLSYVNFSYQYILLNYRYLQLNTPFEVGYGNYKTEEKNLLTLQDTIRAGNFIPFGLGLQLILKPLRWAGLSASGGYRYVKHDPISLSFNGWYYSFGVWVDARYLFRATRFHYAKKQYRRAIAGLD